MGLRVPYRLLVPVALACAGCGLETAGKAAVDGGRVGPDAATVTDAGARDGGPPFDAGAVDAGSVDAGEGEGDSATDCPTPPCTVPTCTDMLHNGTESDVDCGGTCSPCAVGGMCHGNSDCVTGECEAGICAPPPPLAFAYVPSNFDPVALGVDPSVTEPTTTLDCGVSTFDSTTLAFGNWCRHALPVPAAQAQMGGPDVVVLPVRGLSIAAGSSLVLTGNRPVVVAAFGDASIAGTVDASANATAPGPGGNWSCGSCSGGGSGSSGAGCNAGGNRTGGGGGGHATAGAAGGGASSGSVGNGGSAYGSSALVPLRGGCNGGNGGTQFSPTPPGGAGAGAVQISAAGVLSVTGAVMAAGGVGTAGVVDSLAGGGAAGGGSGGGIVLEGNTVTTGAASMIVADGGRGGAGANRTTVGGGGAGGAAGTGTTGPGVGGGGSGYNGGGGGGGAVGHLHVRAIAAGGCSLAGARSASETLTCP